VIHRLGFRRILPLAQLALFIALVSMGAIQAGQSTPGSRLRQASVQENSEIPDWHPQAATMPAVWLFAIAINVPATMLGAICAEIFHIGSNLGGLLCSMPFVLLLWYAVGHWLDHQLNILPRRPPGAGIRIACWVGIVLSAMLLAIGIMALRSHHAVTSEVLSLSVGWLLWSGLLLVMCILTLRRRPPSAYEEHPGLQP
jgi:hypothetical protein